MKIGPWVISREHPRPTWTAIGVSALTFPGQIIEIQVNDYLPD